MEQIKYLLNQCEGIRLEFKEATTELPGNLFESICAMLNREGGDILLGVKDDGTVKGINEDCLENIITNLGVAIKTIPGSIWMTNKCCIRPGFMAEILKPSKKVIIWHLCCC